MNPTAKIPHLPALDGLRALAVLAVLFYHADSRLLSGGFLGVEIFFVISGWLITSLLIAERDATGRVDLKQFWLRRARRLLPALALLLVVVSAVAVMFLPDEAAKIRGDAFSAAAYFNNWFQIFNHTSYFESSGRPSLLKHLWSLSVEEQFYILWPLLFVAIVSRPGKVGVPPAVSFRASQEGGVVSALVLAASVSSLAMALLFNPDTDPTRIYFGTDTRASGMLIGAALAFLVRPRPASSSSPSKTTDALGLASLAALVAACFAFTEFSSGLYRGGFALVALATALLIAAIARRARITTAILSIAPLRRLGERSYGIYLWHFPIFMLTRPQLDIALDGPALLALRFVITLLLAEASYRLVETPVRLGALEQAWRDWREARGTARLAWTLRWATACFATAIIVSALTVALLVARPAREGEAGILPAVVAKTEPIMEMKNGQDAGVTLYEDIPPAPIFPDSRIPTNEAGVIAERPETILAIGDSVMEGVTNELARAFGSNIVVDAKQGRQPAAVLTIARELRAAGRATGTIVLHVGNNGIFREATFDKIFAELSDAKKIIVVNCKVPRAWEQPNNEMLAAAAQRHPNIVFLDWHAATAARPEIFWKDGLHVKPAGAKLYASLLTEAVSPAAQLALTAR